MNNLKKYKFIIIITVILLVYGAIMYFVFKGNNSTDNTNTPTSNEEVKYLVLSNVSNLQYYNEKWTETKTDLIENSNLKFKSFVNNNYLGEYSLKYGKVWNLFDDKSNYVSYNGNLFAYSNNFNLTLRKANIRKINDDDKQIIKDNFNITNYDYLITNEAIDVDLDSNGTPDKIICLSNYDGYSIEDKKNFYQLVFAQINGQIITIINQNNNNSNILNTKTNNIGFVFQNDDDNKIYLSIITTDGIESDNPVENTILYTYENNNFNKVYSD